MDRRKFLQTSSLFALTSGWTAAADALDKADASNPMDAGNSGQQAKLAAHWAFDEASNARTLESVAQVEDVIQGNYTLHEGIRGSGIKFDGFTTRITKRSNLPIIHEAFTIEAWIAPQAYPWNWNALVTQKNRYYLGLDATGHIGLRVLVDGQWRDCVSDAGVPFMRWSHVAASFDPKRGISIYINGLEAGRLNLSGHLAPGDVNSSTGEPTEGIFKLAGISRKFPPRPQERFPLRSRLTASSTSSGSMMGRPTLPGSRHSMNPRVRPPCLSLPGANCL